MKSSFWIILLLAACIVIIILIWNNHKSHALSALEEPALQQKRDAIEKVLLTNAGFTKSWKMSVDGSKSRKQKSYV